MKKRILALVLAVSMVAGMVPVTGYAQTVNDEKTYEEDTYSQDAESSGADTDFEETAELTYGTGLLPMEAEELVLEGEPACGVVESVGARAVSEWDKYANHYYYNQMNEQEQAFYDRLDAVAYTYLTTGGDIVGAGENYSEMVAAAGLTMRQASAVFLLFRYANPQYYFMTGGYGYVSDKVTGMPNYWVFGIYPAFVSGSARMAATAQFKASAERGVNSVLAAGTNPEKRAQAAHDWIINKVSYDTHYYELSQSEFTTYEMTEGYTQSAYSTFCKDSTVCAGYTQAFSLLCNAADIEAISMTSASHAWNKVRLYGNWYEVDCTWDDPVSSDGKQYLFYDFFDRSEAYLAGEDSQSAHVSEVFHATYNSPACKYDSEGTEENGNRLVPGVIPEAYKITAQTAAPVLSASINGSQTTVTLNCTTPGTPVYYYTLDGTNPSVAGTRSRRVSGNTIQYTGNKTVKVIAIVEGYLESSPSAYTTTLPSYTVSFDSRQGTAVAAQKITLGEAVQAPKNPTRKGYTFEGWYKDSSCKTAWDFASGRVTGNMTLYAKWTPVKYKITYYLNKGKNHKSNPATFTITSKTISLKNPTRKGYLFKGWYSDSKFKKKVTKIAAGSTGNQKLYAKWTKVTAPKKTSVSKLQNKKSRKVTVTIKKVSGAAGYQIRYSTKSNMKSAKTVTTTSVTATISKLTKGKTYYVQVRAYKKDSTNAKVTGSWSAKKKITIHK